MALKRVELKNPKHFFKDAFLAEKKIGVISIDETLGLFTVSGSKVGLGKKYPLAALQDFEIVEDGTSYTSGGLGRAIAGGLLFGGVGAVVGAVTGKKTEKKFCNDLRVKINFNDYSEPTYITLIDKKVSCASGTYKEAVSDAKEYISVLNTMIAQGAVD